MGPSYRIRTAVAADLPHLPTIEASAAALFRSVPAVAHFADGEPTLSAEREVELCSAQTLWVATEQDGGTAEMEDAKPWAFIAAERADDSLYILELSVHAERQRRGLAGLLINAVSEYATEIGLHKVSLMTERDVPWNGPMYAKRGFKEVEYSDLGPGHLKMAEHERKQGMDMSRRAMMVLNLSS